MHPVENTNRPAQPSASLWWLHPFWIVVVPLVVISFIAYALPAAEYREQWRTAKAFDGEAFALCVAVAAAFSAGCLLAAWINAGFSLRRQIPSGPRDAHAGQRELRILFAIAFVVTIASYALWFGSILKQGGIGMLRNMLAGGQGASDELKRSAVASMISGVTTLTQLGMGTALLGTYLGFTQGWRKVRLRMVLLFFLVLFRAVFLSERLSLIEVALPSVVLMMRLTGFGRPGSALRLFLLIAPVAGIAALYALFTFAEYFRSWSTFYADRSDQSLFAFTALRLLGYYVTALNNGAIEWHAHGALHFPYATMGWLWNFPVIGAPLRHALGGDSNPSEVRDALLTAEGNPELSNPSGIFVVFTDYGVPGTLLYFAILGCAAALLYGSYRRGSVVGLFLYSFLFVGMTEQVRIIYISTGRAFPTWLLLFAAIFVSWPGLRRGRPPRKREDQPPPAAPPG